MPFLRRIQVRCASVTLAKPRDTRRWAPLGYADNGVVNLPGVIVRPGLADNDNPAALPQIGFIEVSYQNADEQRVSGIDFGANARFPIGDNVTFSTSADASYLLKFEKQTADGNVERYDGTLSPCNNTSCSGSPKWRATWQNTLEVGAATLSTTAYYTGGYDLASTDASNGYSGVKGDCEASIGSSVVTYQDGSPVLCNAKSNLERGHDRDGQGQRPLHAVHQRAEHP
ncbi:MAG: TonB-dependent receptor [Oxalobacteraceae bacterium]|nr:MAG: TonB-dependent receptor [Oxalobacteraceae bacterium]